MTVNNVIEYDRDQDGVVVLTINDPDAPVNTVSDTYRAALANTIDHLNDELDDVVGVVITSGKPTFFAGGNLHHLIAVAPEDANKFASEIREDKRQLRRLETLGRPVVAAINGAALGGGLELALAAHHRIVVDDPKAVVGFPEVELGLLPGAGGVARSVRMLGVERALTEMLLRGQRLAPAQAEALGIVDEVVATRDELVGAAKAWIAANPHARQPWDADGYTMPGGTPSTPALAQRLPALSARLRNELKGPNYPAPRSILAAAVEGAQVDFDGALEIEGRYFTSLATGQVAKNMIQAFFFDTRQVNGTRGRPETTEPFATRKVVVLGAGMMGAGIAYQCAKAGIEVVLKDVSLEAAQRGKDYSRRVLDKTIAKGSITAEEADAALARITPADEPASAAGADLVIEAVFEDPAVKQQVFAEIEPHLAPDALLASNTSTLPITDLAGFVSRPADFLGMHFFSPVDKMPLLEIIKGRQTSDRTLHRALDVARQIAKTPIVVNDSRGFFTSRVIATFLDEAMAMLSEGVPAPSIEQASSQAGYPAPVLQLIDELNLGLLRKIRVAGQQAAQAEGVAWIAHPADAVLDRMLDGYGRAGRLAGAGFYDYRDGKRIGLWPGLEDAFGAEKSEIPFADLMERMLFIESIETVRCMDEGVIETVADANIGSILGIGFPGWTGGVVQYMNGFTGGLEGFVNRALELAEIYGDRFRPPESLFEKAARGETYAGSVSPTIGV